MPVIGIATAQQYRGVRDDLLLRDALRAAGLGARLVAWDDADEAVDAVDAMVLRSTWGYHRRLPEFLSWLGELDRRGIVVLNSLDCVRTNVDKWLQFVWLDAVDAPRVPGVLIEQELSAERLAETAAASFPDAPALVLKPTVSASGHHTILVDAPVRPGTEAATEAVTLIRDVVHDGRAVLLQPFVPEIADGELGLVYLGGQLSHTLLRTPGVLTASRGVQLVDSPPQEAVAIADRVIAGLPTVPAYARIDVVTTSDGPLLMEAELTEPWLGLELLPDPERQAALDAFVAAILAGLGATTNGLSVGGRQAWDA